MLNQDANCSSVGLVEQQLHQNIERILAHPTLVIQEVRQQQLLIFGRPCILSLLMENGQRRVFLQQNLNWLFPQIRNTFHYLVHYCAHFVRVSYLFVECLQTPQIFYAFLLSLIINPSFDTLPNFFTPLFWEFCIN